MELNADCIAARMWLSNIVGSSNAYQNNHHDDGATILYDDDVNVNDNMSESSEGSRSSLAVSLTSAMYHMPLDHPDHP